PPARIEDAHQPVREKYNNHREHNAEGQTPVFGVRHQLVLKEREHDRAQDWAEEIRIAAKKQHEDQVSRLQPVGQARVGKPDRNGDNDAAERAIDPGDDKYDEPIALDSDAEVFRFLLII